MFCPKCGKENSDQNDFCIYCGVKIDKGKKNTNERKDVLSNLRLLFLKKNFIIGFGSIVVFTVVVCLLFLFKSSPSIEGRYISTYSNSPDIYLDFTNEKYGSYDGTYYGWVSIEDGFYKIRNETLQLYNSDSRMEESYIVYKNYLLDVDSKYEGKVPKGKHFNRPFENKSTINNQVYTYIFKADGTMSFNGQDSGGAMLQGTYERIGDTIKYHLDKYENEYTIVVYKDEIYNSGYHKE